VVGLAFLLVRIGGLVASRHGTLLSCERKSQCKQGFQLELTYISGKREVAALEGMIRGMDG